MKLSNTGKRKVLSIWLYLNDVAGKEFSTGTNTKTIQ